VQTLANQIFSPLRSHQFKWPAQITKILKFWGQSSRVLGSAGRDS